jgi:FkbM family methyltransferase
MTTWAFNVLRVLLAEPGVRSLWIAPGAAEEDEFATHAGPALAKCHHFSPKLAQAADVVIYSYRDLRAAAVSYHRKFASPCTREQIDTWVQAQRAWLPHADGVLRYESVEREPLATIGMLRALLARKLPGARLTELPDAEVAKRVEGRFEQTQDGAHIAYDATTMILPAHRTFQPGPEALPPAEKALYDRVGQDFAGWLAEHQYIEASDHGQEMEYRIAADVLAALEAHTVVDVGVERGSFTELALRCGSRRVIGFEPLPRHFEFLSQRYAGRSDVQMHRLALSNRSGSARFHVATDPEGHELDYHHSLGDLGDSASVIRSARSIDVTIAALSDLVRDGVVPAEIDFLKIDTDGHDLPVLEGLGDLRPRVIMAEYWDDLPESSGANPYTLADLAAWARSHGYPRMVVVRRHGRLELVQLDAPWSVSGDWGNVFFLREDFAPPALAEAVARHARRGYDEACGYVSALMQETQAKEAEIRRLDAALQELRARPGAAAPASDAALHAQLLEKEALIQTLHNQARALQEQLVEKEAVLQASLGTPASQAPAPEAHPITQALGAQHELLARGLQEQQGAIETLSRALAHFEAQSKVLSRELEDKQATIECLNRAIGQLDSQQTSLTRALHEKDVAIFTLNKAVESPEMHLRLMKDLEAKEAVIQELRKAVEAYRQAFSVMGAFVRPAVIVASAARALGRRAGKLAQPRLGVLNQHEPRALSAPPAYWMRTPASTAPKISIVTPSFRQAGFIERTMKSVLDQCYPNLEYHVQDGGSDDGTAAILERYGPRLASWDSRRDGGQSEAINLGFARATGDIMAWLNSDDLLLPGALAVVADYFEAHPEVDVVYGHRLLVDENDQEIGRWIMPSHSDAVLSWADYIPQETLFWRRRIWDNAGGRIDESFRFAMDWDLLVRFREAGARFARINRFLGAFRIHPHQKTSAAITEVGFLEMNRIRERVLGRVPSGIEVRSAVAPYLLKHVVSDLGWRIRGRLGARA